MVDIIIENSQITNINASVPIAESDAAECNDDIELMENMQDEDTDDEDEPDFDVDRDLHEK